MFPLVIVAALAGLVGFIASRPGSFRLERSIVINTGPEKPFALVNDFHEWAKWSPFENIDADLKRTYSGNPSGVGAIYNWDGKKAGAGRMEILEAPSPQKIVIKLDFSKPFEAHNTAVFTFNPNGATTTVVWTMTGPMAFINKAMTLVMPMEKMVGPQFEQGLASMKAAAESA
ncbi:MAG TPA: SRPBCC family protein [Rhizomicrobium sp.]|jgi:uncharacterized protein YndB with AHSA1/START domain|nr:SRPBCC family protein [Rhizomicrobium sp.]